MQPGCKVQAGTIASVCVAMVLTPALLGVGQTASTTEQQQRTSIIIPIANPTPDMNDRMRMQEHKLGKENFDAANALRRQQINDDAEKLLILAKDVKRKIDRLGGAPMPPELQREAEVIELLARDVQKRMTMTLGSD